MFKEEIRWKLVKDPWTSYSKVLMTGSWEECKVAARVQHELKEMKVGKGCLRDKLIVKRIWNKKGASYEV